MRGRKCLRPPPWFKDGFFSLTWMAFLTPLSRSVMSQHFYPLSGQGFGKIQENSPKTQHPSAVQTLQHTLDRNWSTPRTRHQDKNKPMSSMSYTARRNSLLLSSHWYLRCKWRECAGYWKSLLNSPVSVSLTIQIMLFL